MKWSYCGKLNNTDDNFFILHPKKCSLLDKEKVLEAKIEEWKRKFNVEALLGQVIEAKPLGLGHSIKDAFFFGASREVMRPVVTRI